MALLLASAVSCCFGLNTGISKRLKGKQNTETLGYLTSDSCECEGLNLKVVRGFLVREFWGFFSLQASDFFFFFLDFVTQKTILKAKY